MHGADDVGLEGLAPPLEVGVEHTTEGVLSGGHLDEAVDGAEAVDGGSGELVARALLGDVGHRGEHASPARVELLGGLLEALGAASGDDHVGSLLEQSGGDLASQADAHAGHDHGLPIHQHRSPPRLELERILRPLI